MARVFNVETGANYTWGGTQEYDALVDFDAGFKVATAQEGQFYNTADETTNYERGFMRWSGNVWQVGTEKLGSGTLRAFHLMYGATAAMQITGTRPTFPQGITSSGNTLFTNNIELNFGNVYSSIMWGTAQTNDGLMIGIVCGAADGSGNIIISEYADRGVDFLHAASANPRFIVQSADATTVADYWSILHNQTNALMEVGAGDLLITIAGGNLAPSVNDGWALGVAATGEVSDIFLASGAVVNFANGGATITHTAPGGVQTITWASTVGYITIGDGVGLAFQIQEGSNSYVGVSTSNGTEQLYLGNSTTNPTFAFNGTGKCTHTGRLEFNQGADVASTGDLELGTANVFEVTGVATINAITTANWQTGSVVVLVFTSTATLKHNTTGGAGTAVALLSAGLDFVATAGDTITLCYCELGGVTAWRELARTLIA